NPLNGKSASTHLALNTTFVGYDLGGPNEVVEAIIEDGSEDNITVPGLGLILRVDGRFIFDRNLHVVFEPGSLDLIRRETATICRSMADALDVLASEFRKGVSQDGAALLRVATAP